MSYLHSLVPPVIHSDLKSKNVLITDTLVAKVSRCYCVLFRRQNMLIDLFITYVIPMVHKCTIAKKEKRNKHKNIANALLEIRTYIAGQ